MKEKRCFVLVMAGGTGGHIFPALAVAQVLKERHCEVNWLGTPAGLEAKIIPENNIPVIWVKVAGIRGKGIFKRIVAGMQFILAILKMIIVILRLKPNVVLGMGGYVSAAGAIAAWLLRRPLVIHEQNALPGFTNRKLSRLATKVLQAFPGAFLEKIQPITIGNPVRHSITALPIPSERLVGQHQPLRILVLGGSQGAAILNEVMPEVFKLFSSYGLVIKHQTGNKHLSQAQENYQKAEVNAEVVAFIDDMAEVYGWADLVICRSGALTVAELAAAGVGAVLIPFPYAVDDHQTHNARFLTEQGAGILLPQSELSIEVLKNILNELLQTPEILTEMAAKARQLSMPDSAKVAADICLEVAKP